MSTPHDTPYEIVHGPGSGQPAFTGNGYDWQPNASPIDPHDDDYTDCGDGLCGPDDGPVPENIVT